ncbi:MAG: serine hydrolase [Gemmatimonadetes bacterium]|nr:serine hydrolase [Gemmatimonadota bacterium]
MHPTILRSTVGLSLLLAACGSSTPTTPNPPPPPPAAVASVTLSGAPTGPIAPGATATLTAVLRDAANNTLSGRTVTWNSTTPAAATVSGGSITAVGVGTTTISATSEGQSASVDITVAYVPASVQISRSSSFILTGDTLQLTGRVIATTGQEIPGAVVGFTVEQPAIAGLVGATLTALTPGQATVRATAGALTTTATITVFAGAGVRVPMLSRLDSVVISEMIRLGEPGGAVAVVKDGRLVFSRTYGYADSAAKRIPTELDKWRIGSVTKPLTALGIMKLVQNGQLTLDELAAPRLGAVPVLPGKTQDPRFANITIRHLLNHAAGWNPSRNVDDSVFAYVYSAATVNATQLSRVGRGVPLLNDPGTVYGYTNYAFLLLGRIIEQVTGQSYQSWMQANILAPVDAGGMKFGVTPVAQRDPLEVVPYDRRAPITGFYGVGTWPNVGAAQEYAEAAGQWIGSSKDLARVLAALDGSPTRADLLSPATLATMWGRSNVLFPGSGNYYSLGWENTAVTGGFAREHVGGQDGGDSWISLFPNGAGIAVQFNLTRGQGNGGGTAEAAIRTVFGSITTWPAFDLFTQ